MAKGIRTILETILLANSFTQALSMIGRSLLLFLSVCCISEITYQARAFRNKNKNIFCSVFHVWTIKIIDIEKVFFFYTVRFTALCVLFCLSLRSQCHRSKPVCTIAFVCTPPSHTLEEKTRTKTKLLPVAYFFKNLRTKTYF